jgi:hypothetical protein
MMTSMELIEKAAIRYFEPTTTATAATKDTDNTDEPNWKPVSLVTQEWDELNEYIYTRDLRLTLPMPFLATGRWACLHVPKLRLRWKKRAPAVNVHNDRYILVSGAWRQQERSSDDNGWQFYPDLEDSAAELAISGWPRDQYVAGAGQVLLPAQARLSVTELPRADLDKRIRPLTDCRCQYAVEYQHWSFNRQGLYLNRKYRPSLDLTEITELACRILEPRTVVYRRGPIKVKLIVH